MNFLNTAQIDLEKPRRPRKKGPFDYYQGNAGKKWVKREKSEKT